jgi:hypothetical protein
MKDEGGRMKEEIEGGKLRAGAEQGVAKAGVFHTDFVVLPLRTFASFALNALIAGHRPAGSQSIQNPRSQNLTGAA